MNFDAARANLWRAQKRFNYFPDIVVEVNSYRFNFKDEYGQCELKEPYLVCTVPPEKLEGCLKRRSDEFHWNNLEIGCWIRFHRRPNTYMPDVHTLMSFFHE